MKTYTLKSGSEMPVIGLGTWKSAPGDVGAAVKEAIQVGYRHIDCAAIYGNEKEIGEALAECFKEGIVKREDLFITSKLWNQYHAPEDVCPALEQTLSDLQVEYLDSYLIHWPVALKNDGPSFPSAPDHMVSLHEIPISKTWGAMEECVDKGLTKNIGVSNFSKKKLDDLLKTARIPPAVNQVERHPYLQQNDLLKYCLDNGVNLTAYSPLGSFDRPDGMKKKDEPILIEEPHIASIADKHGVTPAQVLLKWGLQCGTSVIPKSTNPKRIGQNLATVDSCTLDEEDMAKIAGLDRHRRYVDGAFWCMDGSPYTLENLWDE